MIGRVLSSNRRLQQILIVNAFRASFDCSRCQKITKNPQCKACSKMISYFNLFSIPQKYQVDSSKINEKAKQLQKQFHPDKNIDSLEANKFAEYSAYINRGKTILSDDLKRAVYLMEIRGFNMEEQSFIQDSQFTADMFELQEQIEQSTPQQAQEIAKRIEGILNQLKGNLNKLFQREDNQKCKQFLCKYKYLHRALKNAKTKQDQIHQPTI